MIFSSNKKKSWIWQKYSSKRCSLSQSVISLTVPTTFLIFSRWFRDVTKVPLKIRLNRMASNVTMLAIFFKSLTSISQSKDISISSEPKSARRISTLSGRDRNARRKHPFPAVSSSSSAIREAFQMTSQKASLREREQVSLRSSGEGRRLAAM